MNTNKLILLALLLLPLCVFGQIDPHYTMFMYNKLIYNPGYAGSREVTSADATYRDQWVGITGAPRTLNVSIDGLVGDYMKPFRKVAIGLSLNNEKEGVINNTNIKAYYAYRIKMDNSVLSLGLEGGGSMFAADINELNLNQTNDPAFLHNINNKFLPNFGTGAFWYGDKFYAGFTIPNLLENYYDKNATTIKNIGSREVRSYYLSGGYVFPINDVLSFEPQGILRYAGDAKYKLPMSMDINASFIIHSMLMLGITYRTDASIDFMVHVQATKEINIGYSYDYSSKLIDAFNYSTHEIVIGYNFIKDRNAYANPRFVKSF